MYSVIKAFTIYLDGINPTRFEEGLQDLPERAAEVALAEGWAEESDLVPVKEESTATDPGAEQADDAVPVVEKKRGRK